MLKKLFNYLLGGSSEGNVPDGYWGAKDGWEETDYQLCAGVLDLPKPRHTFNDNKITYQQTDISNVSCTIHGAIGAISDLTGYKLTDNERQDIWNEALANGADPKVGWYVNKAVDITRRWWNQNKPLDFEIVAFSFVTGSEEHRDALLSGYSVVTGYRGNQAYNDDYNADSVLNLTSFGAPSYGHCIRIVDDLVIKYDDVVDNYPKTRPKTNIYKIPDANMIPLRDNDVFFNTGYVFAIKDDMGDWTRKVSPWAIKSVEKARSKGIMTKWDNPQEEIAPANSTLEWTLFKLGGLTKTGLSLSKERLAVSLDKLKLLD